MQVNAATKVARIEYDPGGAKISDFLRVIRSIGYAPGTATTRLPIKNLHCSSCVIRVELALQLTPGIFVRRCSVALAAGLSRMPSEEEDRPNREDQTKHGRNNQQRT